MNKDGSTNTLGIPTQFTIDISTNTMIFLGVALTAWIFHKQLLRG